MRLRRATFIFSKVASEVKLENAMSKISWRDQKIQMCKRNPQNTNIQLTSEQSTISIINEISVTRRQNLK